MLHGRLGSSEDLIPKNAIAKSYAGPGLPLPEIQVGFRSPDSRGRGRMTCLGVPAAEVKQVATTVLESSIVQDLDRAIQVRLLGTEKYQRRYGLALAVAVISGVTLRPVPPGHLFLGEIDLHSRLRDVPDRVIENLLTSIAENEISTPATLVVPVSAAEYLDGVLDIVVVPCATVAEVVEHLWPKTPKRKSSKQ